MLRTSNLYTVVNESHICGFLDCMLVVLYGGDERVNSVMGLCAGFGAKLVRGESVVGLGMRRNTGGFGQGVIEVYAPVGGRVSFVFGMSFVDWLHEGELPVGRLYMGFPYTIKK